MDVDVDVDVDVNGDGDVLGAAPAMPMNVCAPTFSAIPRATACAILAQPRMKDTEGGERRKPAFLSSFSRNTVVSLFTTALDLGVLTSLVELFHVNYVLATWLGTVVGCLSNFFINRSWSFAAGQGPTHWQLVRFVPVQVGSSALQTFGVWLLTAVGGLAYFNSKLAIAVFVYLTWNYPLNRFFVFAGREVAAISPEAPAETRRLSA